MKRKALVRQLEEMGCRLIRGEEDTTGIKIWKQKSLKPIPRHSEINDNLAEHIIRMLKQDG